MTDLEFFMHRVRDTGRGHNIGELRKAIYRIASTDDAQQFFRGEEIARSNIGYLLGYLNGEERRRKAAFWVSACGVRHPIFGSQAHRRSDDSGPPEVGG